MIARLLAASVLPLISGAVCCSSARADWPQAAANPARTGSVAEAPQPPFRFAWTRRWGEETLSPIAQPIVLGAAGYLASENGVVHALDVATGRSRWSVPLETPVCNTLAGDSDRIYAAAADGAVHALKAADGEPAWTASLSRRAFTAAPLLMDGKLFIGNRDGRVYALSAESGRLLWSADAGAPITQTAAGADGLVVLLNDRLELLAIETETGEIRWSAGPLPGDRPGYWPVIVGGRVIICLPEIGKPFELQKRLFWPVEYNRPVERVTFRAKSVQEMLDEQEIFAKFLRERPEYRRLFFFNLSDGVEPAAPSVIRGSSENGEPVVATSGGEVYTVFRTSAAQRGLINITRCAIGRIDLRTGRLARPIVCGDFELAPIVGVRSPFELTSDEPVTLSAAGDLLVGMRCNETPGAINVRTGETFSTPPTPVPHANDLHNAQAPPVVAAGCILAVKFSSLICLRGQ